jgi:hypothetical protein
MQSNAAGYTAASSSGDLPFGDNRIQYDLIAQSVVIVEAMTVDLDGIHRLVLGGEYFFYTHALTEAKKDRVTPEDVVHAILTGEVIEEYPDRQRVLVFAMLTKSALARRL